MEIADPAFLLLAERGGAPNPEELASLQAAQAELPPGAPGSSLWALACARGVLAPAQVHSLLRDAMALELEQAPTGPAPQAADAPAPVPGDWGWEVDPPPAGEQPAAPLATPQAEEPPAAAPLAKDPPPVPLAVDPPAAPLAVDPPAAPLAIEPAAVAPAPPRVVAPLPAPPPLPAAARADPPGARPARPAAGAARRPVPASAARPPAARPPAARPPAAKPPAAPVTPPTGGSGARRKKPDSAEVAGDATARADARARQRRVQMLALGGLGVLLAGGAVLAVVSSSRPNAPGQVAQATPSAGKSAAPEADSPGLQRVRAEEGEILSLMDQGQTTLAQERVDQLLLVVRGDAQAERRLHDLRREIAGELVVERKEADKRAKADARKVPKSEPKPAPKDEDDDPFAGIDGAYAPDPNVPDPSPKPSPEPERPRQDPTPPVREPPPDAPRRPTPRDDDADEDGDDPGQGTPRAGAMKPPRKPRADPVPPLGPDDAALIRAGGLGKKGEKGAVERLVDAFVDRAEASYLESVRTPEGFKAWLRTQPELRRAFWLALDPRHDDVPAAIELLVRLKQLDAAAVIRFPHLAVAFAVVWDDPEVIGRTRKDCLFSVEAWEPLPDLESNFRYFTDPKNQSLFQFRPDALQWPTLVYVVDMDLTPAEIAWGREKFAARRSTISATYDEIEYDDGKREGKRPKLGRNPYNLMNLKKYGGVCGDQSHFATRLAKLFCIPATKCQGEGRHGGRGHAWYGALTAARGRPQLEFWGRYLDDFYYTGDVLDPHTGRPILDRELMMMLDGASLSYPRYVDSLVLARMAQGVLEKEPDVSLALASAAIEQNQLCAPAWALLMEHTKRGTMKPQVGVTWLNELFRALEAHPDFTLRGLATFMSCLPADELKKRARFYEAAGELFRKAQRPDLAIALAEQQADELIARGDLRALDLALAVAVEHAKEGDRVLPLVERADELARARKRMRQVVASYEKIANTMPKFRQDVPAPAYRAMLKLLLGAYEAAGMKDEARRLREREKLD